MKKRKCAICGKVFIPTAGFHKYCGNQQKKIGCSYKAKIEKIKTWRKENPIRVKESRNPWQKNRRRTDPKFRLDGNITTLLSISLKGKKAGKRWEELVGYTIKELMEHLEKQFDDKMTWDNYGSYWWLDHIKPVSLFHYSSPTELSFRECWALKNLRPLEKAANMKKGNRIVELLK
jgi:hypothetical protein